MNGFLGDSWDDPRTQMILAMSAGLLGNRGNFGQGLSAGLMGGVNAFNDARKMQMLAEQQQREAELKRLQIEAARKPQSPLRTVGNAIFDETTRTWITPPQPEQKPSPYTVVEGKDDRYMVNPLDPGAPPIPLGVGIKPPPPQYTFLQGPQGFMPANSRTGAVGAPVGETFPRGAAGGPKSPAQDAVDKAFAKEYIDFTAGGGYADVEKNLNQLRSAATRLSEKDTLTGPVRGRLPDFVREITNPKAIDVRDSVTESVQRNLRIVLGAQFTEKEGERLIARAYNSNLDDATNARRVNALVKQIEDAARTKLDAVRYYEENGTLRGWNGRQPTMADFEAAIDNAGGSSGRVISQQPSQQKQSGPKKINSDAEYNALPSGTEFIDPEGKRRRKP